MGPSMKRHIELSAISANSHPCWSGNLLKDPNFILITGLHALFLGFPLAAHPQSIANIYLSTQASYSELFQEQAQGWVVSCCLGFSKEHRLVVKFSGSLEEDQQL